jgi:hypothetical protein
MKTVLLFCAALAAVAPARAQIFRPGAVNGAILGGIAGAVIGNNSGSLHHNGWQGAAIGATAGLLLGAATDDSRYGGAYVYRTVPRGYGYYSDYGYSHTPRYSVSIGYGGYGYGSYGYGGYAYGYPDYRGTGLLLGGITGAIIGNNSRGFHHNAWRGAAWGAGLGYLFGAIAEDNARYREVIVERPAAYVPQAPATQTPAQNITIINNYYNTPATPMSSANGLFGRN